MRLHGITARIDAVELHIPLAAKFPAFEHLPLDFLSLSYSSGKLYEM
jgi:hypothetical protein